MKLKDWQELIARANPEERISLERELALETQLVDHAVSDNEVDYSTAEWILEKSGSVLKVPLAEITEYEKMLRLVENYDKKHLQLVELANLGLMALQEFERVRAYRVVLKNIVVNRQTFNIWENPAANLRFNEAWLKNAYSRQQDRFRLAKVELKDELFGGALEFTFGYKL